MAELLTMAAGLLVIVLLLAFLIGRLFSSSKIRKESSSARQLST
jgi:hypothetical protein